MSLINHYVYAVSTSIDGDDNDDKAKIILFYLVIFFAWSFILKTFNSLRVESSLVLPMDSNSINVLPIDSKPFVLSKHCDCKELLDFFFNQNQLDFLYTSFLICVFVNILFTIFIFIFDKFNKKK